MISNSGDAERRGDQLFEGLVRFSTFLRDNGIPVSTTETLLSMDCVLLIDMAREEQLRDALRAAMAKRSEDYPLFERLFNEFWKRGGVTGPPGQKATTELQAPSDHAKDTPSSIKSDATTHGSLAGRPTPVGFTRADSGDSLLAIYSPAETIGRKDFGKLSPDLSFQLRRSLKRFARRVATQQGRRSESSRTGVVDLRRTLREGLDSGGQLVELKRKRRKISKSNILVLCDISGSMDSYSDRLLRLLYYFCNSSSRADVFVFSTRLVRLNDYLEGKSLREASQLVSESIDFWSSGTRIGSALGEMLTHNSGYLHRSSVLVIISDGWELDDLEVLERNLRSIGQRVSGIIWLNPLADNPEYEPLTAGMMTALPYVRVLAGLNVFDDRREFERAFGLNHVGQNSVIVN